MRQVDLVLCVLCVLERAPPSRGILFVSPLGQSAALLAWCVAGQAAVRLFPRKEWVRVGNLRGEAPIPGVSGTIHSFYIDHTQRDDRLYLSRHVAVGKDMRKVTTMSATAVSLLEVLAYTTRLSFRLDWWLSFWLLHIGLLFSWVNTVVMGVKVSRKLTDSRPCASRHASP